MDEYLLAQWNNCVGESDTVYILGDLFFRNTVLANEYLNRLHGKKHLIKGNHDKDWMKKADLEKHFASISSMLEISDGSHKITLCHYPGCMGEHNRRQSRGAKGDLRRGQAENKIQLPYAAVDSRGTGTSSENKGAAGELPKAI